VATDGSVKAVVTAMFANLGIAVTKFVAFLLTASSSMLAESVHSLADTSNQALLLLGGNRAKRAATPEHPFGYGRERYVYAFIGSIVLRPLVVSVAPCDERKLDSADARLRDLCGALEVVADCSG
jgi:divalent metal cation (Fe/Co/Zn/Cd) transporter